MSSEKARNNPGLCLVKDRNLPLAPRQVVNVTVIYCITSSESRGTENVRPAPSSPFLLKLKEYQNFSSSFRSDRPPVYIAADHF